MGEEQMNEFSNVAKDLGTMDNGNDVFDASDNQSFDEENQNLFRFNDPGNEVECDENESNIATKLRPRKKRNQEMSIDSSPMVGNKKTYECNQCDYQAAQIGNLKHHIQS